MSKDLKSMPTRTLEIEEKNKSGKSGTGVRSGYIYSTLLGQKRYIHALQHIKNTRVLDCASGNGWGSFLMGRAGAKEVVGVELSEAGYQTACEYYNADNIQYICSSLQDIIFPEGHFDVLTSFETIEHVENPVEFLKKLKYLAHSDSILLMSTPNGIVTKYNNESPRNPYHLEEYSKSEMEEMFVKSGWKIKEYRGQYIMNSDEELNKYRLFIKNYWSFLKNVKRFGILYRILAKILPNIKTRIDPAYQCNCNPEIVPLGGEPAYHYFILTPR